MSLRQETTVGCPSLALCHEHRQDTAVRNCTGDRGGPFEAGYQVQASSHCKLPSLRAMMMSVAAKRRDNIPAGTVERGERKQTADEVSKSD